jgi:hypothetical protein
MFVCSLASPALADVPQVRWGIDNPRAGALVTGLVWVKGWILSYDQISNIDLYVNGEYVSSADHDQPRTDLIEVYPEYNGYPVEHAGFSTGFLARNYSNGSNLHLELHITLTTGETVTPYPSRDVVVDNTLNQPPFGNLDLPLSFGDQIESVSGHFPVVGWALDGDGFVAQVDVMIDGMVRYGAWLGDYRPDVKASFGMVPGAEGAGFVVWVDSNALTAGVHLVSVRLTDNEGLARVLGPKKIQVFNVPVNQPPFGQIDIPLADFEFQSSICGGIATCPVSPCTDFSVLDDVYIVAGWALDTGSRRDLGGIGWVELMWDGAIIWNTRTDCMVIGDEYPLVPPPLDTAHVNCYGYYRPDVNMMFPGFEHSENSGWEFVLDVYNQFIAEGQPEGLHQICIRAGDIEEGVNQIDCVYVKLTCPTNPDYQTLGYIDFPGEYEFVSDTIQYTGWALDRDGLTGGQSAIEVWVDGRKMGLATYGFVSPDVVKAYPNYPLNMTSNARFVFYLDTTLLSDGEHDTWVTVIDNQGHTLSELGKRRIVVDNNVN